MTIDCMMLLLLLLLGFTGNCLFAIVRFSAKYVVKSYLFHELLLVLCVQLIQAKPLDTALSALLLAL